MTPGLAKQANALPTNKLTYGGGLGLIAGDLIYKTLVAIAPEVAAIEVEVFGSMKQLITYGAMLFIGWYIPDYANLPMPGNVQKPTHQPQPGVSQK